MPTATEIYEKGFEDLFYSYCDKYHEDPAGYIKRVNSLTVPKMIIMRFYKIFVSEGMPQIEDLPRAEKEELVDECGDRNLPPDIYRAAYAMKHRNKIVYAKTGV